ncbi:transcriptional regulator NrdR [Candidatus Daviesbacteria bacterium RIFCSPLOWO2_01_FULL_43_38]|uniref:Transcriptional repressor NrdR n=2 Tax=Candidatus Daviesiibacteriota TaxID=1752718 RepID=A0A1F5K6G7_9BACT|nr:MAG: ATP-cone domain-containing protein [Candidatus Daviesbacteria bacterium GW2011_GWA1_42_6]OGE20088.1 MAG: transcriptional regulator NrdR [Candidatus Daviesbacteria bacterium RIFCSPHIGHO2_01_FULL_43_17]OGE36424.1 MAG: transcriptional regulator NrdR [Candidatus Daviesbacteria bacterium RIFCSPHIGHO2_12_FULL_43_11]OGE63841.1 MAG: transcriptional regulator NrdR [Candidatus Daviesbacteria bacterium RIFCSPLOWO2_01_FULL_43_38]OGE69023.1 MAG: transcriptional regulator NrdR [Candidatus Daviesbacte
MTCPFCDSTLHRVVDKRSVVSVGEIRRRRQCLKCLRRFTTYERWALLELQVIKKDGRREDFNREKLRLGIVKALEKRPLADRMDYLAGKVEKKIRRTYRGEVSSKRIGQAVLLELKKLDTVAYLRFASVYRSFENPEDFSKEINSL